MKVCKERTQYLLATLMEEAAEVIHAAAKAHRFGLHHDEPGCGEGTNKDQITKELGDLMEITLCGSTKFMDLYHEANKQLTLAGHLVYSVASSVHGDWVPTQEEKAILDVVHLMKIHASDSILVISDETGYVGESTEREIYFAKMLLKNVYYLQNEADRVKLRIENWKGKKSCQSSTLTKP